jgi:secreted trypsin-like serine protease
MNPNPRLNLPDRRPLRTLLAVCIGALASIFAMSPPALASSGSNPFEGSGPLAPQIINGPQTPISSVPWQVFLLEVNEEEGSEGLCGGSILDATHVLTAAHCVIDEKTNAKLPVTDFFVIVGASEVSGFFEGTGFGNLHASPAGREGDEVSLIRVHPYHNPETFVDDVAVLTLKEPLKLSAANSIQPIALAPTGSIPAAGSALTVSGYGKQEGAESGKANGKLYSTTLTAISPDGCRAAFEPKDYAADSPVLICAAGANTATCQGDSGGPLVEGNPAVQVGIVDFGPNECPPGRPDSFTNVAAPEVRDFIEGSEAPPVASRSTSPPVIKSVGAAPVDLSPLTCEPGGWTTPPTSISYTFQVENASAQVLQSATSNIFAPPSALVGAPLVCIVQATSPGGTATARSAATAPIAADTVAPVASITARMCKLQSCTLSVAASDPNAVAFTLDTAAAYSVTVKCPKRKKKKKGKQPVCHKTKTVPMSVVNPSAGVYQASVSRLPYSEKITFTVLAANAAGLTQVKPAVTTTTLHKPKPKPKKKSKKQKKH